MRVACCRLWSAETLKCRKNVAASVSQSFGFQTCRPNCLPPDAEDATRSLGLRRLGFREVNPPKKAQATPGTLLWFVQGAKPRPLIKKPPPLNRDSNRDPHIKALKRRELVDQGSTLVLKWFHQPTPHRRRQPSCGSGIDRASSPAMILGAPTAQVPL